MGELRIPVEALGEPYARMAGILAADLARIVIKRVTPDPTPGIAEVVWAEARRRRVAVGAAVLELSACVLEVDLEQIDRPLTEEDVATIQFDFALLNEEKIGAFERVPAPGDESFTPSDSLGPTEVLLQTVMVQHLLRLLHPDVSTSYWDQAAT